MESERRRIGEVLRSIQLGGTAAEAIAAVPEGMAVEAMAAAIPLVSMAEAMAAAAIPLVSMAEAMAGEDMAAAGNGIEISVHRLFSRRDASSPIKIV